MTSLLLAARCPRRTRLHGRHHRGDLAARPGCAPRASHLTGHSSLHMTT